LLTCLVIWRFLRLRSWRQSAVFAGLGILLFHAHAVGLVTLAALGALTLVSRDCAPQRRWFWPAALVVFAYATPWIVLSRSGHAEAATSIAGIADLGWRLAQFAVEFASVTPLVALLVFAAALWWRRGARTFEPHERAFVMACAAVMLAQAAVVTVTQTPTDIWVLGLHHTPALIPLTILLVALCVVKLSGQRNVVVVAVVLLLAFTRVGQLVPWVAWAAEPVAQPSADTATFHVPPGVADRVLRTTQVQFVRSLLQPNPGTISRVTAFLREHAEPGDRVLTNAESQALYFHTGLPLAAKIAPSFPIYAVARAHGLPEYVFGHEGLRWIVWRRAFPAYFAEQDIDALLRRFATIGIRTTLVATFPETVFENRENIHFRRYPGGVYVFPWHDEVPDVRVYRVEWPEGPERWYVNANERFAAQEYTAAIADYERFLHARPEHLDALTKLGMSYVLAARPDDGIRMLRRVMTLAPNDGLSALALANALFQVRRADEAEQYARRAVAVRPRDPLAWDALGRSVAVRGRPEEAMQHFERALALDPDFADARRNLERVRAYVPR
jgi:hypothetical protein